MQQNKGFTMVEMMIVIAIIAIVAAIATPSVFRYQLNSKVRNAVYTLKSDLEWAKARAIKDNTNIDVIFNAAADTYLIRIQSDATVLKQTDLTPVDLGASIGVITFSSSGRVNNPVTLTVGLKSLTKSIGVNIVGRTRIL